MLAAQMLGDVRNVVEAVGLNQNDLHLRGRVDVDDLTSAGAAAGGGAGEAVVHIVEKRTGSGGRRSGRGSVRAVGSVIRLSVVVVEFVEIVVRILAVGLCQLLEFIHKSHNLVSSNICVCQTL